MTRNGAAETGTPVSRETAATPITPAKTPLSVDRATTVTPGVTPSAVSPRHGQRKEKEGQTGSKSASSPSKGDGPLDNVVSPPSVFSPKRGSVETAIQAVDCYKLDVNGEPIKEQERVSYQNMIVRYAYSPNLRTTIGAYFLLALLVTTYKGHSEEIGRMTGTVRVSTGHHIHCCCDPSIEQLRLDKIKEKFHMENVTNKLFVFLLVLVSALSPLWERFIGRRKMLYAMLVAAIPASVIFSFDHASFIQQFSHLILALSPLMILMVIVSNLIEMLPYETRYLAPFCYYFPMNFSYTTAVFHFGVGFSINTLAVYSIFAHLIGIILVRFFIKDSICHLNIRNDVKAIEEIFRREEYQLQLDTREGSRKFHKSVAKKIFEDIVYLDQDELKLSEFLKRLYKSFTMIEIILVFFQSISAGIHEFETERFTNSRFTGETQLAQDRVIGFALAGAVLFFVRKSHRSRVISWLFAATLLISATRHAVIDYDVKLKCAAIHIIKDNFNFFAIVLSVISNALVICIKFTILLHFLETSPSIIRPLTLVLIYLPVRMAMDVMKKFFTTGNLDSKGSSVLTVLLPVYAYHLTIILITMLRTRSKLPFSLYLFDLMPQSDSDREENHGSHEKIRQIMEVTALPLNSTEKVQQEIKDQKPEEKPQASQEIRGTEEQEKSKWSFKRISKRLSKSD